MVEQCGCRRLLCRNDRGGDACGGSWRPPHCSLLPVWAMTTGSKRTNGIEAQNLEGKFGFWVDFPDRSCGSFGSAWGCGLRSVS